jgi:putative membrane protein
VTAAKEDLAMRLLLRWGINMVAILAAAYLLRPAFDPSVTLWAAVAAGLLLGLLNTFVRPLFKWLSLPINVLTLGLFTLIINGAIVQILSWLMGDKFHIRNFGWAILVALMISIVTSIINIIVGGDSRRNDRQRG